MAGAFVAHHARGRLHQHLVTGGAHGEGQVGVFVIGRRVTCVQAADLLQQRAPDCQRRARDVIHFAHVGIARIIRRFEAAVAPGTAVAEDHAAGFLQAAVRIQQLRADQARARMAGEGADQRIEPARLRHGVVVQQHHVFAATEADTIAAGGNEAAVAGAAVVPQATDLRQHLRGVIALAGVVDNDDLARQGRGMRGQRTQAGQGMGEVVVDRDDDRDDRCIAGRYGKRRECRGRRKPQRLRAFARPRLQVRVRAPASPASHARAGSTAPAARQAERAIEEITPLRKRHAGAAQARYRWRTAGQRQAPGLPAGAVTGAVERGSVLVSTRMICFHNGP